jgi:hypothetical protein
MVHLGTTSVVRGGHRAREKGVKQVSDEDEHGKDNRDQKPKASARTCTTKSEERIRVVRVLVVCFADGPGFNVVSHDQESMTRDRTRRLGKSFLAVRVARIPPIAEDAASSDEKDSEGEDETLGRTRDGRCLNVRRRPQTEVVGEIDVLLQRLRPVRSQTDLQELQRLSRTSLTPSCLYVDSNQRTTALGFPVQPWSAREQNQEGSKAGEGLVLTLRQGFSPTPRTTSLRRRGRSSVAFGRSVQEEEEAQTLAQT